MKIFQLLCLLLIFPALLLAQEAAPKAPEKPAPEYGWKKAVIGGINITQTSFDNWTKGGENTLAWQLNLNFNFTNEQEKFDWANTGKFVYGHTKSGDAESRKSLDEIKLESVLTYKRTTLINPFLAATGESQLTPGYEYEPKLKISALLDPGYFRESAGIGYKPSETVKTRLGVALKQTITDKYALRFTGDAEETMKNEIGAESVTDLNWKISATTLLISKLELFSTLKAFDETDVNWDNVLSAKLSKYFNVNLNFKLFYDKDISKKRQIKQALALGLTYSFL